MNTNMEINNSNNEQCPNSKIDHEILLGKSVEQKEIEDKLIQSPFLYQVDNYKKNSTLTIEDFYIIHNNKYVTVGDIVRSIDYTEKEKRKILKATFAKWNSDTEKEIFRIFEESKKTVLVCVNNKFEKLKFKYIVLLFLSLVISVLPFLNIIKFLELTNKNLRITGTFLIVLSIIGIMLYFIYNSFGKRFKKSLSLHKFNHTKYSKTIFKKLKKSYRLIYKYYIKKNRSSIFSKKALNINKIKFNGDNLRILKSSTNDVQQQYELLNRNNKNKCYAVTRFMSYFNLILCSVYIALIIFYFIKK